MNDSPCLSMPTILSKKTKSINPKPLEMNKIKNGRNTPTLNTSNQMQKRKSSYIILPHFLSNPTRWKFESQQYTNLVKIDFCDLVRDADPVGLSHMVPKSPIGQILGHLEQVLLLSFLGFIGDRRRSRSSSISRVWGTSAEASEETRCEPTQVYGSIRYCSMCETARHFRVTALWLIRLRWLLLFAFARRRKPIKKFVLLRIWPREFSYIGIDPLCFSFYAELSFIIVLLLFHFFHREKKIAFLIVSLSVVFFFLSPAGFKFWCTG